MPRSNVAQYPITGPNILRWFENNCSLNNICSKLWRNLGHFFQRERVSWVATWKTLEDLADFCLPQTHNFSPLEEHGHNEAFSLRFMFM